MLTFKEFNIEKLRSALSEVKKNGQKDSLRVWYHPEGKVFVSVGDWVDHSEWHKALAKVVGKNNIVGESESGPSGKGWVQVRDTKRISDSVNGMDEHRKKMVGL